MTDTESNIVGGFKPLTRGLLAWEAFAVREDRIYGKVGALAVSWCSKTGRMDPRVEGRMDLVPQAEPPRVMRIYLNPAQLAMPEGVWRSKPFDGAFVATVEIP